MPTPPLFFLPFLPPELAEASYAHMAEKCEKITPGPRGRVYSISFVHERVVWVATVGKHLKGHRPRHRATARLIEDPAMVLAIFPGTPYTIVTDALHATGSNFQNIFFGTPVEVNISLCHRLRKEIVPRIRRYYRKLYSVSPRLPAISRRLFTGCAIIDEDNMPDSRRVFTSNVAR